LKQLTTNLGIYTDNNFTEQDYLTFDYFRLRRNTIAHRNIEVRYSGAMKSFIEQYGTELNEYWSKTDTVVRNLDFTSKYLQFENKDSVVDVINILRDTTPRLEMKVIMKLTDKEWVEYLFSQFKKEVKAYDINVEGRFIKSFNSFTFIKLNRIFDTKIIKEIVY
jgi:hypothetical protein